jgi:hypothetical protein
LYFPFRFPFPKYKRKAAILPVVLYGWWSLTLRKEDGLTVFENWVFHLWKRTGCHVELVSFWHTY